MSKRHAREHGRILSVDEETLGSVLVADAASGATTLYVDDAAEFEDDGTGGWLSVNDQVIEYDTVDDDAGTIHLKTGLSAAADDGDPVYVWSKLYDTAATVKTALVMVDGEDENTDPIHAVLADAVQDLPEGLRGEAGENCTLVRVSDDEWEVSAVSGRPSSTKGSGANQFEDQDTFTATAGSVQSFTLSHLPVIGSVHMAWNSLWQPHTEFTVDYLTGQATVPDPQGIIDADDVFDFRYAYRPRVTSVPVTLPAAPKCANGHPLAVHLAQYAGTSGAQFTLDHIEIRWEAVPVAGWHATEVFRDTNGALVTVGERTDSLFGQDGTLWTYTSQSQRTPGPNVWQTVGLQLSRGYLSDVSQCGYNDPANCTYWFGQEIIPGQTPQGALSTGAL